MKKTFTFTVPPNNVSRTLAAPPGTYTVELLVDEQAVIRKLGHKAARSKGRKAAECGGAVVVKILDYSEKIQP